MKRILSTTVAAVALALGTVAIAQPAQAITNPASNPRPITVKGDDGKTYTDGEDTLPGFDDDACTYIPGAYFDFDNNRVRYADGQSIPWTEWERATGYKEWQAKKSKPAASTPPPAAAKPAPTTAPKKATATPKPAASQKAAAPKATAKPTATPTATPSATATPKDDADETTAAATAAEGTTTDEAGDAPAEADEATDGTPDEVEDVTLASESADTTEASAESDGTGSAGLLILAGLAGAGALAYAGYTVVNRRKGSAA